MFWFLGTSVAFCLWATSFFLAIYCDVYQRRRKEARVTLKSVAIFEYLIAQVSWVCFHFVGGQFFVRVLLFRVGLFCDPAKDTEQPNLLKCTSTLFTSSSSAHDQKDHKSYSYKLTTF